MLQPLEGDTEPHIHPWGPSPHAFAASIARLTHGPIPMASGSRGVSWEPAPAPVRGPGQPRLCQAAAGVLSEAKVPAAGAAELDRVGGSRLHQEERRGRIILREEPGLRCQPAREPRSLLGARARGVTTTKGPGTVLRSAASSTASWEPCGTLRGVTPQPCAGHRQWGSHRRVQAPKPQA